MTASINPERQKGPHAHGVVISRGIRKIFVADLAAGKIFICHLNSTSGSMGLADLPTISVGPGPVVRHFGLAPEWKVLYAIAERNSRTVFRCSRGAPRPIQTISGLPNDAPPQIGRVGTRVQ